MLCIDCLVLGDYMTNCYLVREEGSRQCCIIDPGYEAPRIRKALESRSLTPEAILLTHGHFDHVGAVGELAAEYGCQVYIHEAENTMPPAFTAGRLFYTDTYRPETPVTAAGLEFRVLHTPGHTPGSVCLLTQDVMFSGDTLFAGSCGRTDLPGGSMPQILHSLQVLAALPGDCRVFPGHGPATTLERERADNPWM